MAAAVAHAGSADGQAPGVDVINLFSLSLTEGNKVTCTTLANFSGLSNICQYGRSIPQWSTPYHASVYGWAPGLAHKLEQAFKILPGTNTLAYFDKV